jgi:hypothetical protein
VDSHVGMLLDKLEALGVLDDLVVIVSSDHGENLGELGLWSEHGSADAITCRIPMIIPLAGKRGEPPTRGCTTTSTSCPRWPAARQGAAQELGRREFRRRRRGRTPTGRDQLVVSQCCHVCQRSVRWGDWLYIRTWHDFFHLFPKEMLSTWRRIRNEQHILRRASRPLRRRGRGVYLAWHDDMMFTQPEGYYHDPLWEVIHRGVPATPTTT